MAKREDYDWKNMSDPRLAERLMQEEWNAQHKNRRVDRAMAHRNVEAIVQEQARRYEDTFNDPQVRRL